MMKLYKLTDFGSDKSNLLKSSIEYFQFVFSGNNEFFKSDAFMYFNKPKEPTSLNYVEDNEFIKSAIKLTLPKLANKFSFYINFDDYSYIDYKLYTTFEENGFKISSEYMERIKVQEIKLMTFKDKIKSKKNKLKIKLLTNKQIKPDLLNQATDILNGGSDILVFVTGGGFIADLEKIAQFYLRK
jgi:hypothetical protein